MKLTRMSKQDMDTGVVEHTFFVSPRRLPATSLQSSLARWCDLRAEMVAGTNLRVTSIMDSLEIWMSLLRINDMSRLYAKARVDESQDNRQERPATAGEQTRHIDSAGDDEKLEAQ